MPLRKQPPHAHKYTLYVDTAPGAMNDTLALGLSRAHSSSVMSSMPVRLREALLVGEDAFDRVAAAVITANPVSGEAGHTPSQPNPLARARNGYAEPAAKTSFSSIVMLRMMSFHHEVVFESVFMPSSQSMHA